MKTFQIFELGPTRINSNQSDDVTDNLRDLYRSIPTQNGLGAYYVSGNSQRDALLSIQTIAEQMLADEVYQVEFTPEFLQDLNMVAEKMDSKPLNLNKGWAVFGVVFFRYRIEDPTQPESNHNPRLFYPI